MNIRKIQSYIKFESDTAKDIGNDYTPNDPFVIMQLVDYKDITDSVSNIYWDSQTIAANSNKDIDLSTLTDAFGDTISVDLLSGLFFKNISTTSTLYLGGYGVGGFDAIFNSPSTYVKVKPGGAFNFSSNVELTDLDDTQILRITNTSLTESATYTLGLIYGLDTFSSSSSSSST